MRKIVSQGADDYRSVFSSTAPTPQPRSRARSEGGHYSNFYYESDGYESSNSVSSSSSMGGGLPRGRPKKKKKAPIPIPKQVRGRSVSPSVMSMPPVAPKPRNHSSSGSTLKVPSLKSIHGDDNAEVQSHSLFDDADVQMNDEYDDLNKLTQSLSRNIDEELQGITSTLEDRKKGFFEEAIRNENEGRRRRSSTSDGIDPSEISSRRREFVENDLKSSSATDVRADLPKTRHKVRRINSNAQLNAVFRKRRQMSEVDTAEGQQQAPAQGEPQSAQQQKQTKDEMANVLNQIQSLNGE